MQGGYYWIDRDNYTTAQAEIRGIQLNIFKAFNAQFGTNLQYEKNQNDILTGLLGRSFGRVGVEKSFKLISFFYSLFFYLKQSKFQILNYRSPERFKILFRASCSPF